MKDNAWMERLKLERGFGDFPDSVGLAGSDIDIAAYRFVGLGDLILGPSHQVQDLLRPLSQQHSLLCQRDLPAASDHQLLAQILFQLPELAGEGGLCQVQRVSRR